MIKKAIILVSGGIDSTTLMAKLSAENYQIMALSFSYGQNHEIELKRVRELVKYFGVADHKIINIDLRQFGGSALTDEIAVPKYDHELPEDVPITYVPARNTIFLSYALAFAETTGAGEIYIGVHATDHANYPDCRPEFIEKFSELAELATNVSAHPDGGIKVVAPFINMTKTEIVKLGLELGVDYSKTISCYDPIDENACGECLSCLVRINAFKENGTTDPAPYHKKTC